MSISKLRGQTEINLVGMTLGMLLFVYRPAIAQSVEYIHTDALGTPVAVTDADRNVLETSELEPFGKLLNRPLTDEPGYTGHVSDAATGLSYMQQRYYDPGIGRFLSVDPVTADGNSGGNFNRYKYAANNPYRFTDPDGRQDSDIEEATAEKETNKRASSPGPGTDGGTKSQFSSNGDIAGSRNNTTNSGGGASRSSGGNASPSLGWSSDPQPQPQPQSRPRTFMDAFNRCMDMMDTTPIEKIKDNRAAQGAVVATGLAAAANVAPAVTALKVAGPVGLAWETSKFLSCGVAGLTAPLQNMQDDPPLGFLMPEK